MSEDIRWQQRFESFQRALRLLRAAIDLGIEELSDLEKEGLVQRFETTLELGWNTLRDFLEFSGVTLATISPKTVVKEAFAAKLIPDGQLWIDMLNHRNLRSHTYDEEVFADAVEQIEARYLAAFEQLQTLLEAQKKP